MSAVRLGLIGENIAASRAPELHRTAGRLCGIEVTYDLLIPKNLGLGFDQVFNRARDEGYRGLNITYPYKEAVLHSLQRQDKSVRWTRACNTALFEKLGPIGANTDFTGFASSYRHTFGAVAPGVVALAGCGGVGRAVSFALVELGAQALQLFDADRGKSELLTDALSAKAPSVKVTVAESIYQACKDADGLVNCTPLGMVGHGGSAFPAELICAHHRWAFDAVYTPVETPFLRGARAAGLEVMSGYELFFYQGVDAFGIFTGHKVDCSELREALQNSDHKVRLGDLPGVHRPA